MAESIIDIDVLIISIPFARIPDIAIVDRGCSRKHFGDRYFELLSGA